MSVAANHNSLNDLRWWRLHGLANSGPFWIVVSVLSMLAVYWTGLSSLLEVWERPEYSHGYLIPLIAAYLFLTRMSTLENVQADLGVSRVPGVCLILLALAVGVLGNLVNIPDISTYGFIICAAGLVLVVFGTRQGLQLWVPMVYLVFMLPLPNFLYWPLSIKLQMFSSEIGVGIISLFGVPVFLDGNIIDLGVYKLQVAEACSGLRYLFPLASFGFLFAVLYKGPFWHKLLLFVSSVPITVAMNCLRIGIIGVLVDRYGIAHAEGFLHAFEGWVIFVACLATLYLEAVLLQLTVKNRRPVHTMLDINFNGFYSQLARFGNVRASRALVFVAMAILVTGVAWHLAPARAAIEPTRDPLVLFPLALDEWRGQRSTLDSSIERVLGADDYLVADYVNPNGQSSVNLFIAYYKSQTNGSGIHSPEVCIPAGGWEVSNWKKADTAIRMSSGQTLKVNRAIIQKGLDRQLVYYWFEQRGRQLTSDYAAKGYAVWDSMTRGRTDGALVRVVTAIGRTEQVSSADQRLKNFLGLTLEKLSSHVPG